MIPIADRIVWNAIELVQLGGYCQQISKILIRLVFLRSSDALLYGSFVFASTR